MTESDPVKSPDSTAPPDSSPRRAVADRHEAADRPVASARTAGVSTTEPESAVAGPPRTARGRGEPPRQAATTRAPRPAPASRPAPPAKPEATVKPTPSGDPTPARPEPAPRPALSARQTPAARPEPAPRPTPAPRPAPPDDLVSRSENIATSRLGGLRNLLIALGRKSLDQDGEREPESDVEPRFERATVRPAYPNSPLPAAEVPESGAPGRLTAQPEFLPPKPVVEIEEKEREAIRPTSPRFDKPDIDEIQTLPSWRGQYRKKRYPPM